MKFRTILISLLLATATVFNASADSLFPDLLRSIEEHNTDLRTLSLASDAASAEAHTGLSLANPEISVGYLLGVHTSNETDVEVSQSFDFATLSGAKRRVAEAEAGVIHASMKVSRADLMLRAEKALINHAYLHALTTELRKQCQHLSETLATARAMLAESKITLPEYSAIELEMLTLSQELEIAETDLAVSCAEIQRLNGGHQIALPESWPMASLPTDFDGWLSETTKHNSTLGLMRAQAEKSRKKISLRRSEGLPDFSVSYVGQMTSDYNLHGVALTFSVPLWGNSGRVKAAKAMLLTDQLTYDDAEQQIRLTKRTQYDRALQLHKACSEWETRCALLLKQTDEYLDSALAQGKISRLDYLTQKGSFHEHIKKGLELRRDFLLARADLYAETL